MKYLLFFILSLTSVLSFAERETRTIRTPSGDLVKIGDSKDSLIRKLEVSQPRFYVLNDGRFSCAATEYVKSVNLQEYTITLCRDNIVKITWRNL